MKPLYQQGLMWHRIFGRQWLNEKRFNWNVRGWLWKEEGNQIPTRHGFRVGSACLKTIFVAHLFYEYVFCIQPTIGASMLPTIQVLGDHVLIARSYRRGRGVQVGDVVSFASVIKPRERVIKRVIGMPGDWVLRGTPNTSDSHMIQVPDGHCWVVGDNLEYSRDSRHYGPVPLALIYGKVIATVFPWSEKRWIQNGFISNKNFVLN